MKLARILSLALVLSGACGDDDEADPAGDGSADGSAGDGSNGDGSSGDGAGDGSGEIPGGACDSRNCNVTALFTCYQWTGDDASNEDFCTQLGGTAADGPCPTEDLVAGCKTPSPFGGEGCAVNWVYPPITREDVEADCADRSGEVLTP